MTKSKYEIFIASRFHEFKTIREKLRTKINHYKYVEAIDLNNNEASHRSPLAESLFYVRKSEIMVLLIGETYGTIPEGEKYSFTHLEYKEAIKDITNTRVLVFCIGESYAEDKINYSDDEKMKSWQIELEKNHRLKKFQKIDDVDLIVEKIFIDISSSLHDLSIETSTDIDNDLEDIEKLEILVEEDFLEDSEVLFLDNKNNEIEGIDLVDNSDNILDGFSLLKIPNKLAAIEQKKEAQYAIDIRDYSTAIKHLKKALSLRPLDFESNYWLAKLYITSAKKSLFYDIEEYLIRAAKIAESQKNLYKASHCYQLIVQASIFSDKKNEGLKYLEIAEQLTPRFSRFFYEKAKFMLYFNMNTEAKKALIETINIRMDSVKLIEDDPFFKNYESIVNELFGTLKQNLHKICYAISSETNNIRNIFNYKQLEINLTDDSITKLWQKSRNLIVNQYNIISKQINSTNEGEIEELKKEIEKIENNKTKEFENSKQIYDGKVEKSLIFQEEKENIEKNQFNKYVSNNYGFSSLALIISIICAYFIYLDKNIIAISIACIMITFIIFSFFNIRRINNNLNNKIQEINKEHELDRQSLTDEYNNEINIINEKSNEAIKILETQIQEVMDKYQKINRSFKIFEETTITISKSKFIPFKSLKNSSSGDIIRVNNTSYQKYLEQGYEILILEDLPKYLMLKDVDITNFAFMAKVIKKTKSSIVLSRLGAYKKEIQNRNDNISTNNFRLGI